MIFSCDQAALRTIQSVCPSVRPSVCPSVTPFSPCSCHRIITTFQELLLLTKNNCPCNRSRSDDKGQGHRGQHPTYPFPDCNSSLNSHMAMKSCTQLETAYIRCPFVFQGHLSNFKVTRGQKIADFDPNFGVCGL